MIPPRKLVLSGGGIKVVSMVGSLKLLEERGLLKKINEVSGVSAGAWLAFMISCGLPMKKIEKLVLDLDFGVIRNLSPDAILGFPETFGLDDGMSLRNFLETIMKIALHIEPKSTFLDLKGDIQFRCWATDLNTSSIREFSLEKTPTVRIVDALYASMAIPFYFIPAKDTITGHMLSDGGIQGSLPLHHLTDEECSECLAIGFCKNGPLSEEAPQDLMGFANSIFSSILHIHNETVIRKWSHKIIRIPVDEFPSWNFEASREDRQMLIKRGLEATVDWLQAKGRGSRKILRRHSFQ
jgi:predicted acylesterase/phospholipase RssA